MAPLRTSGRLPPSRLQLDIIPAGTVSRARKEFEARIATQHRDRSSLTLARAEAHARALGSTGRMYMDQLNNVTALGLFNLTPSLAQFSRDHENMHRTIRRAFHIATRFDRDPDRDVLAHAAARAINLRNMISYSWITSTGSPEVLDEMRASSKYANDITTLRLELEKEFARVLTVWDDLASREFEDEELENVGPDHDIDTLGETVKLRSALLSSNVRVGYAHGLPTPPPSPTTSPDDDITIEALLGEESDDDDDDDDEESCTICGQCYTESHPAFTLKECGHIYGKHCISQWVNSTARNATTCPQCRKTLCPRRPRRPINQTFQNAREPLPHDRRRLQRRLQQVTTLFGELSDVHGCLWGEAARNDFFNECMAGLNERFFVNDLGWVIVVDEAAMDGWRVRRAQWH